MDVALRINICELAELGRSMLRPYLADRQKWLPYSDAIEQEGGS